ncbi:MAG: peptide chain release factor N(5)-glutamine methyltransferase [Anaerolineales bacterium]|nr:peptide chain release factor N(5)-glutamine methyltransferase [Anaerolineales bacterium]
MTLQEALRYGRSRLQAASPTPELDARLLLQHVLQVSHVYLIAHRDEPLTPAQAAAYEQLLARARQHEPVPYLTGTAPFYGHDFVVTPAVLIPRPETELLVARAVDWARGRPAPRVVDVGTGSGCIAISLALALPRAAVTAVDASAAALQVAAQNVARLAAGRVRLLQGDLLSPLPHAVDLIVANLPYVTDEEWTGLDDGVKLFEPAVALKGGQDGLDLIGQLLQQATAKLTPGGAIFLEIGWRQGQAARRLALTHFPSAEVRVFPDDAGHDRIVMVQNSFV